MIGTQLLTSAVVFSAPQWPADGWARFFVWIAVPAVILATLASGWIKFRLLSSERFHPHRPSLRVFAWVGIADMIAWAVLWPSLLVVRVQGPGRGGGLWILALLMVVALGYVANRYGFGRAFDPAVAGSMRGTLLAELFTIMMPVLAVAFGLVIFWCVRVIGGAG